MLPVAGDHAKRSGAGGTVVADVVILLAGLLAVAGRFATARYRSIRVEEAQPEEGEAAEEAGLPDAYVLAGLVYAESRGRAGAVSSIGALGLCQLMPSTAQEVGGRYQIEVEPLTPADNLRLGAYYLAEQLKRFDGDLDLALIAYRVGPNRVARELRAAGGRSEYEQQLRRRRPSPWGYRDQVLELSEVFRARAVEQA